MDDLRAWLDSHGLVQHFQLLVDNDIDMAVLRLLDDRDLQELGLSLGHRRRLLKGVADMVAAESRETPQPQHPPQPVSETPRPAGSAGLAADPMLAGERRQLTVLFCDMVGFTALASRVDPEVLQGVIRRYESACAEAIRRYEGHVFQLLGDGVVAFFGYPQAHEDEAERAIRAALDMVQACARIELPGAAQTNQPVQVRVGIATGVVVVLPDNGGAVGDTMNLAARLQGMAQPGSVVTSPHVRRFAGAAVGFESLGEHVLKGIEEPMTVWRVTGLRHQDSRFQAMRMANMLPLVGRRAERALMQERWRQARAGRGQVVVISGEAGIGKSRLARVMIDEQPDHAGGWAVTLQCSPFHLHSPLYPVAEYLRQRILADGGGREGHEGPQAEARWSALEAYVAGTRLPAAETVPLLAELVGVPPPAALPPSTLSPERARVLMRQTLLDLLLDRASTGPGTLLLEDLHWADPSTLDLVTFLVERVCEVPVLLVLTHRPEFTQTLPKQLHVSPLLLRRLSPDESAELVRLSCRDAALPPELLRRVAEKTDGVPLYIEEFSQAVVASRQATMAAAAAQVVIPSSLRDSLFARLDLLGPAKGVAQLAAMLGREFQGEVLAAVWPGDTDRLAHGLERLIEAGFLQRVGGASRRRYVFKHALIQDAAYESMLRSDRVTHHRRIAQTLEAQFPDMLVEQPEVVAHHFAAGQVWDKAGGLWLAAGALALRRNAHVESVAHLRSALGALGDMPDGPARALLELDVQITLGTALVAAKGYASDDVAVAWHRAQALCLTVGEVPQRIPALFGLWMFNCVGAHHEDANALAMEIIQRAEALGSDDLLIEGHLAQGISNFFLGRFDAALHDFALVDQLYDPARHGGHCFQFGQDPAVIALIYEGWIYWLQGDFARAVDAIARGVACARALEHPFTLSFALCFEAWHRIYCREAALGLELGEQAGQLCLREDIPVFLAHALVLQGWGRCELGEAGGAAQLQAALDTFRATGSRCFLPHWTSFQASHLASQGDTATARTLMDGALAAVAATGERWAEPEVLRLDALLQQRQGAAASVVEAGLRQSLQCAHDLGARAWALRTSLSLAEHLAAQGQAAEGIALLRQAVGALPASLGAMPSRDVADAARLLGTLSV